MFAGAVGVYNTVQLLVTNSTFEHNGPVSTISNGDIFQIYSGGLSIGVYKLYNQEINPTITVKKCTFVNNTAHPSEEIRQSLSKVFRYKVFNGRGGALGIVLSSQTRSYNVVIEDCVFINNTAQVLGGGIYVTTDRKTSHHLTLNRNIFRNNWSGFGAGGVFTGSFGPGTEDEFDSILFTDCYFIGNSAERGGGVVYAVPGTQGECNIN